MTARSTMYDSRTNRRTAVSTLRNRMIAARCACVAVAIHTFDLAEHLSLFEHRLWRCSWQYHSYFLGLIIKGRHSKESFGYGRCAVPLTSRNGTTVPSAYAA